MSSLDELWRDSIQHQVEHIRNYELNSAFWEGQQWLSHNPVQDVFVPVVDDDPDRIRVVFNLYRAACRTIMASIMKRPMTFVVYPTGADDVTLRSARLGEAILADLHQSQGWHRLREYQAKTILKGGTGALAVDWSVKNDAPKVTVLSVDQFTVEPGSPDPERARWWMKLQLLPPKTVQAMFPDHFPDAPPQPDGIRGGTNIKTDLLESRAPDLVRVYTYYERPNKNRPKGRVQTEVSGIVVEQMDWGFPFKDRLNFTVGYESSIENRAFGSTVLSDARRPQVAYNAAWSAILEHMRDSSTAKLFADYAWKEAMDGYNDAPGVVFGPKNTAGMPDFLKTDPVPGAHLQVAQGARGVLDDLFGVHAVSRGQAPANIESGYGLEILNENDNSPTLRVIQELARTWTDVAVMVLALMQQEVKKDREAVIHDGSAVPARLRWKGKDIRDQLDAEVPLDGILPKSEAAQRQLAMEAVQMGLISPDDPFAVRKFATLADMPDRRSIIAALNPDIDKAIRENELMARGEVPVPREFDDHAIHIQVLNEFRKSPAYEELEPEQRRVVDNHAIAHERMAAEELADRQQAADFAPALAGVPMATGAPPLPAPAGGPPPAQGGQDMVDAMMASLNNLG